MYKEIIQNEEIREMPLLEFPGKIEIIDDLKGQESAAKFLRTQQHLGFDTEAKPSFKRGVIHPVAILQLSTLERAFLFRVKDVGLSEGVIDILADPSISKIGVAITDDIKDLRKLTPFEPAGFIAFEQFVKQAGIQANGLRKLAAIILGGRISKGSQVSNWAATELTDKQKIYAATDAWVSLKMFEDLVANGFDQYE